MGWMTCFIGLNKAESQVLLWSSFYACIDNCILPFPAGLKLGWMTQKIWVTWVIFDGSSEKLNYVFECVPDF